MAEAATPSPYHPPDNSPNTGGEPESSGADVSAQKKDSVVNGHGSPKKTPTKLATPKKLGTMPSPVKSPNKGTPKTPDTPGTAERKKLPMNKIQVGAAPSPNLKVVKSKIGSLNNAKYKPGGGNIKIENRKLDFSKAQPRIEAKNQTYTPGGGDKKIQQQKLQWNAKPKVGSLDNATYKPGGGEKKIESVKLDFKEKAKPKVGSKDNIKHTPGGGTVKIEDHKLEIKALPKIGSMDNVKHKPGGGDKKIFDDKDYLKQMTSSTDSLSFTPGRERQRHDSTSSRGSRTKSLDRNKILRDTLSPDDSGPELKVFKEPLDQDQNSNQLNQDKGKVDGLPPPVPKDANGNGKGHHEGAPRESPKEEEL